MQLSFDHHPSALESLSGEWNALLDRSATPVPFLRHEVVSIWWSTLGGGEWPGGKLWLGTARDADGSYRLRRRVPSSALLFAEVELDDHVVATSMPSLPKGFRPRVRPFGPQP